MKVLAFYFILIFCLQTKAAPVCKDLLMANTTEFISAADYTEVELRGASIPSPPYPTTKMLPTYFFENYPLVNFWIYRGRSKLLPVKYLYPWEKQKLEVFVNPDGLVVDSDGLPISNRMHSLFVMNSKGQIYISDEEEVARYHHSTILRGRPTAAAGSILIKDGVVIHINNRSGHYRGNNITMGYLLRELEARGADLSQLHLNGAQDDFLIETTVDN